MSAVTVQHRVFPDVLAPAIMFQCQCVASHLPVSSSPGPWAECNTRLSLPSGGKGQCFNPHPARGPSATRPGGNDGTTHHTCFNPHPARRPSATRPGGNDGTTHHTCFNPHPARRPSATSVCFTPTTNQTRFNPHPARRPSATRSTGRVFPQPFAVSILTRPVGRVQLGRPPRQFLQFLVSILTRPVGRVQHAGATVPASNAQFQSSPGP